MQDVAVWICPALQECIMHTTVAMAIIPAMHRMTVVQEFRSVPCVAAESTAHDYSIARAA